MIKICSVHQLCILVFQPEVLEQIHNLKELWLDNNSLQTIPGVSTKQSFTLTVTTDRRKVTHTPQSQHTRNLCRIETPSKVTHTRVLAQSQPLQLSNTQRCHTHKSPSTVANCRVNGLWSIRKMSSGLMSPDEPYSR